MFMACMAAVCASFVGAPRAAVQVEPPLVLPYEVAPTCPPARLRDYNPRWAAQAWDMYAFGLQHMGEPVLACGPSVDDETYRFTFAHAFTSRMPVSVRLSRRGNQRRLVAARYRWTNSDARRLQVQKRVERELSVDEWDAFLRVARALRFSEMQGLVKYPEGNDGAMWMLESRRGRDYHLVVQWSPDIDKDEEGRIHTLGSRFAQMAGMQPLGLEESWADYVFPPDRVRGAEGLDALTHRTGWITLGILTEDLREWAVHLGAAGACLSGGYELVDRMVSPCDPVLPGPGERIRLTRSTRVILKGYRRTGEARRAEAPQLDGEGITPADETDIVLRAGTIVTVHEIYVADPLGPFRIVDALVSPE